MALRALPTGANTRAGASVPRSRVGGSSCSRTALTRKFGNLRSPAFSRMTAFLPSQTRIQSPAAIFNLLMAAALHADDVAGCRSKPLERVRHGACRRRRLLPGRLDRHAAHRLDPDQMVLHRLPSRDILHHHPHCLALALVENRTPE